MIKKEHNMAKNSEKDLTNWKERYEHVFNCYCSLWNSALNFIAENCSSDSLDRYLEESMGKDILGKSTFSELQSGVDKDTFLEIYIQHHRMIGGDIKIVKADEDEIIVDLVTCGSKSMLTKRFGNETKYYCRHCEIIPLWEQMGWNSEVDISAAEKLKGQNIGCRRIFKRKKGTN
jgi:hypothetical protein